MPTTKPATHRKPKTIAHSPLATYGKSACAFLALETALENVHEIAGSGRGGGLAATLLRDLGDLMEAGEAGEDLSEPLGQLRADIARIDLGPLEDEMAHIGCFAELLGIVLDRVEGIA